MHYGTLAAADAYHAARANVSWAAASEADRTAALVRASDYVDARYQYELHGCWHSMFAGEPTEGRAQDRAWPRTGVAGIAPDEVPIEVERATYEAALRELAAPGFLMPDYIASEQVTRVKVGPIEESYAAASETGGPPNMPLMPMVDRLLAALICRRSAFGIGVRVV